MSETNNLRILSLGAGVQSSTVALMMERGIIKKPTHCIFADTKSEPKKVMEWLNWLQNQVSFPILHESKGNLYEDTINAINTKYRFVTIPVFTKNHETGKKGLLRRQCTNDYKIRVINKTVRKLLGLKKYERVKKNTQVTMIMGISKDEATRMKTNPVKYITNEYPLIDLKMSRQDCLNWLKENDYPKPPRSACTFCPFHSNEEWLEIKQDKEEWENVIKLDKAIRTATKKPDDKIYLHRECKPIDEIDFESKDAQINLFENECEGMCGV